MSEEMTVVKCLAPLIVVSRTVGIIPVTVKQGQAQSSIPWRIYSSLASIAFLGGSLYSLYRTAPNSQRSALHHIFDFATNFIKGVAALFILLYSNIVAGSQVSALNELSSCEKRTNVLAEPRGRRLYLNQVVLLSVLLVLQFVYGIWKISREPFDYLEPLALPIISIVGLQFAAETYLLRLHLKAMNKILNDLLKRYVADMVHPGLIQLPLIPRVKSVWSSGVSESECTGIPNPRDATLLDDVLAIRSLHRDIRQVFDQLNFAYGFQILMIITATFVDTTISLFVYLTKASDDGSALLAVVWAFFLMLLLYAILSACHLVTIESERTGEVTQSFLIRLDLPKTTRGELREFSLQLMHMRMEFSAFGFFTLDYTMLQGIIGTVTTYLVIMIQFSPNSEAPSNSTQSHDFNITTISPA